MPGRHVKSALAAWAHASPVGFAVLTVVLAAGELLSVPWLSGPLVFSVGFAVLVACGAVYIWHITHMCWRCARKSGPRRSWAWRVALWMLHRMVAPAGCVGTYLVALAVWGVEYPAVVGYLSWLWMALAFQLMLVHKRSVLWCPLCLRRDARESAETAGRPAVWVDRDISPAREDD